MADDRRSTPLPRTHGVPPRGPERGGAIHTWISAIALVLVVVGTALFVRSQLDERRRDARSEAFVGRAGEQVDELRELFERPPRDLSEDRRLLRRQLSRITDELGLAEGPEPTPERSSTSAEPRFALGRLYAAIGDVHTALAFFDAARALGSEDPRLGYARGLALSELEAKTRHLLRRLPASPTRTRLLELAHDRLALAAKTDLEAVRPRLGGLRPWADIHIAFLDADYTAVLTGIEQVDSSAEARRLAGRSLLERARLPTTADPEADLEAATVALEQALEVMPSHPETYIAICALRLEQLGLEQLGLEQLERSERTGGGNEGARLRPRNGRGLRAAPNLPAGRARAEVACGDGLRIDPTSFPLRASLAALHRYWAQLGLDPGADPSIEPGGYLDALEALLAPLSEEGMALELTGEGRVPMTEGPSAFAVRAARLALFHLRGDSHRLRAEYRVLRDEDPADGFERARAALQRAAEEARHLGLEASEGSIFQLDNASLDLSIARWQHLQGGVGNPVPWLRSARQRLETLEIPSGSPVIETLEEESPGSGSSIEKELLGLRSEIREQRRISAWPLPTLESER